MDSWQRFLDNLVRLRIGSLGHVARCIGACGLAPAMLIDDEVFKQVNVNKLESILTKF